MKKLMCLAIIVAIGIVLYGCKVPPFNPKADAIIKYFTDTSDVTITALSVTGSPPHNIKANILVANGVDINFNQYIVEYYDTGGNQLPIKINNKTSFYVTTSSSSITTATGNMPFAVTNQEIITYQTNNSIKQMLMKVYLYGDDINGNGIECKGQLSVYF